MNFKQLSKSENLSYDIMNEYKEDLDWTIITKNLIKNDKLEINFIREFKDYVCWLLILKNYKNITIEFVNEFNEYISWTDISKNPFITFEFFSEFKDKLYVAIMDKSLYSIIISKYCKLHPEFIELNKSNLNLNYLIDLNDIDDIRRFKNQIDWNFITSNHLLSNECFIREFKDYLNWDLISSNNNMSIDFIKEFQDYINWSNLSANPFINLQILREFKDILNWQSISRNKSISIQIIREFKDILDWQSIDMSTFFDFEFIDEFKYYILWQNIETNKMIDILFQYMDINPMFIEDYKFELDWELISYQFPYITDEFITKYKDMINFMMLYENQYISNYCIIKYQTEVYSEFDKKNEYGDYDYEFFMIRLNILNAYVRIDNYNMFEEHTIYKIISNYKIFSLIEQKSDIVNKLYKVLRSYKIKLHKDLIEELWKPKRIEKYIQINGDIDGYLD